jgi:hypothetical protein
MRMETVELRQGDRVRVSKTEKDKRDRERELK